MFKKLSIPSIMMILALCVATSVLAEPAIHGFAQAQVNVENDNYTARIPRYGLRIIDKIDDEFTWLTEFYIHPTINVAAGRIYMESAWIDWNLAERVPWDFRVRFGKGRNECYGQAPYYSRRRTSDYTLYSESFTQLRVVGFQTFSTFGKVQLAVALVNPNNINAGRDIPGFAGGTATFIPINDRDNDQSKINRVAVSGRLGYKTEMVNVGASLYMTETGPADNNAHNRYGVDGEFKYNCWLLQGQFTTAQTAVNTGAAVEDVDHMGGEILAGWEKDKAGLYARYGMLSFDDKFQAMNQIMLSGIYKIRPTVHLRLEALINGEEEDTAKGWNKVDNDRIFFETLFAF